MPALNATDRRILELLLVAGASEAEVARKLGMSVTAVRQRKCRLVRKLAVLVGRQGPGDGRMPTGAEAANLACLPAVSRDEP